MSASEWILKALAVYSLFLTIFGTIMNLISIFICMRRNLRKNPTFIFFAFMLAFDTLALYQYNLSGFYKPFNSGIILEHLSEAWCKVSPFLQTFSLHASVWLLVAISVERLLSIKIKHWRKKWFTMQKALYISIAIIVASFAICIPVVFAGRLVPNPENISESASEDLIRTPIDYVCFYDDFLTSLFWIFAFSYSLIPFITLLLVNSILIRFITKNKTIINRSAQDSSKRRQLSKTVIILTFLFLILTTPNAIVNTLFIKSLSKTLSGSLILLSCSCIGFTYHSISLIVLIVTNKHFSNELKDVLKSLKSSNRISHNNTDDSTTMATMVPASEKRIKNLKF